jgi:hypothetical protein
LDRFSGDADQGAVSNEFGVIFMGGVPDRLLGALVTFFVAIADCDELWHGNGPFDGLR